MQVFLGSSQGFLTISLEMKKVPPLNNARHERFAQEMAKGDITATDAYVAAGFKPDDGNACKLANRPEVQDRIQEITGKVLSKAIEKAAVDKAWVLGRLVENVDRAMQARAVTDNGGQPVGEFKYDGSVANRALELLGKELGMFVERKEVGGPGAFTDMTDEDLAAEIKARAKELGVSVPKLNS